MTSSTAGEPCVSVPVLSKITVSTSASFSIWRAALDDDAGARRVRHRGKHGGRRRDADASAVIDDDERQEAVEVAGDSAAVPVARAKRRQHQPIGKFLGVVLHPRVADRRRFDEARDLPAVVAVPTRMARTVSWPSRMTVAANTASPFVRMIGRPSPVMVFWSIMA